MSAKAPHHHQRCNWYKRGAACDCGLDKLYDQRAEIQTLRQAVAAANARIDKLTTKVDGIQSFDYRMLG